MPAMARVDLLEGVGHAPPLDDAVAVDGDDVRRRAHLEGREHGLGALTELDLDQLQVAVLALHRPQRRQQCSADVAGR